MEAALPPPPEGRGTRARNLMENIALKIAYDGSSFYGWQKTKMGTSVEECLQKTLEQITQQKIQLQAASRTDRGVHAEGQVVNFFLQSPGKRKLSLEKLKHSIHALLPNSLLLISIVEMPENFHPTLDTIGKQYVYEICFGPHQLPKNRHHSWHVPHCLDIEAMKKGSSYLLGEHDFSAFCNMRKNLNYPHKVRTIYSIDLEEKEVNRLYITINGNHFLYKMARNIVGLLVDVGRGKFQASEVLEILLSKVRSASGITAPAFALTLKEVYYSGVVQEKLNN